MSKNTPAQPEAEHALRDLLQVMAQLRHPQDGCPWDREQDHASIAPYTIEEAYEVADAIDKGDTKALCDELGDLLLQVVFQARIAEEAGNFDFADIARTITDKMITRHPHIFGSEEPRQAGETWEEIKAQERIAKNQSRTLDGVAKTLPAMLRAYKLQKRAARIGFDWTETAQVLDKINEELGELTQELTAQPSPDKSHGKSHGKARIKDEVGDLLFSVINLARHLDIDPEDALKATNDKFTQRFNYIEDRLIAQGTTPADAPLEIMESLWQDAKTKA